MRLTLTAFFTFVFFLPTLNAETTAKGQLAQASGTGGVKTHKPAGEPKDDSGKEDKSLLGTPSAMTIMVDVFNQLKALTPYMMSSEEMNKKENEEKILSHLINLNQAFSHASHNKEFGRVGLNPTLDTMKEHLKNTAEAFANGHKDFALLRLKAATNLCLSCHSQLPNQKALTFNTFRAQVKQSDFNDKAQYGDFLFLLRDYPNAVKAFQDSIKQTLGKMKESSKSDPQVFETINPYSRHIGLLVKKIVTITAKGQRDLDKTKKALDGVKKLGQLPKTVDNEITQYLDQIKGLKANRFPAKLGNDQELASILAKDFEPNEDKLKEEYETPNLTLLLGAGAMLEYLYNNPTSKFAPNALYWISVSERAMARSYFYSLADVYLKECVRRYPASAYAKKCYEEYEAHLIFGYTGTSGTNIPREEKNELNALKKLIEKAQ